MSSTTDSCGSQVSIEILDEQDQDILQPDLSASPGKLAQVPVEKNIDHRYDHHHLENSSSTLEQIAADLKTSIDAGITGNERDLDCRIKAFGSNQRVDQPDFHDHLMGTREREILKELVLEALKDGTIILLVCCASLSLVIDLKRSGPDKALLDVAIIFLSIFFIATIGNIFRFLKKRWILKRSSAHKDCQSMLARVVREGTIQSIPASQVVVGDVVLLETGDDVPADGLFIDGTDSCKLDDGWTGKRRHANGAMYASMFTGAKVIDGSCRMLVTSVGRNTERSKLIGSLRNSKGKRHTKESKLQNGIHRTNSRLEKIGLGLSLFVLIVQVVRCFLWKSMCGANHNPDPKGVKNTVEEMMIEATKIAKKQAGKTNGVLSVLCILFFATRDGFPLGILVFFFIASKKMKSLATVQNLSACATLGSVSTVCLSNTGDLTLNHARMGELWVGLNLIQDVSKELSSHVLRKLQVGVCMNYISGCQMEDSLIFWAQKVLQVDNDELSRNHTILRTGSINVDGYRNLLVRRRIEDEQEILELHRKGGLEGILSQCSHYYDAEGAIQMLDEEKRANLKDITAGNHLQCFAFAYKIIETEEDSTSTELDEGEIDHDGEKIIVNPNDHNHGWILIGLVLLKNPYPPEVKQAIKALGDLRVNVKLLVDDDDANAARILAINSGILTPGQEISKVAVIEGSVFRNNTEEGRLEIIDQVHGIAKASPADKLLMVQCLQKKGDQEVAITGSCTRDLPSLIEADAGIFLDYSNIAEMAKRDADIIITRPRNTDEIVRIIMFGRYACQSVAKFLELHLILNCTALTINFIFDIWRSEQQLSSAQLLWTNVVVEVLGAFALGVMLEMDLSQHQSNPDKDRGPPPAPSLCGVYGPILTKKMWGNVVTQTLIQVTILLVLRIAGKDIFHVDDHVIKTMVFSSYILCQVFVLIGAMKMRERKINGVSWKVMQLFSPENFLFLIVTGMMLALQILLVEIMAGVVGASGWGNLDLKRWLICVGIAGASALVGYATRWLMFGWR